jgi:hypothetical protein
MFYLYHMKPILLAATLFLCTVHSFAQCPSNKYQWEFAGSYGLISAAMLRPSDSYTGVNAGPAPNAACLTVRYFVYNRLAIGATGGFASAMGTYTHFGAGGPGGNYKVSANIAAAELYYIYTFRKYIELYALAGVGMAFVTTGIKPETSLTDVYQNDLYGKLMAQVTPLGVRVGGRLGAFAEVGYGYKGIVSAGVSFKLGPSCWWANNFH